MGIFRKLPKFIFRNSSKSEFVDIREFDLVIISLIFPQKWQFRLEIDSLKFLGIQPNPKITKHDREHLSDKEIKCVCLYLDVNYSKCRSLILNSIFSHFSYFKSSLFASSKKNVQRRMNPYGYDPFYMIHIIWSILYYMDDIVWTMMYESYNILLNKTADAWKYWPWWR